MPTISAIIIAKNEEAMIGSCIKSLLFCDEIIVIDNISTDRTEAISKKLGVKVYTHKSSDFSEARNFGRDVAKSDWLLYVDADERVSKELTKSILSVVKKEDAFSAYKLKRQNFYLGNHPWPQIEKLERLFKKSKLKKWYGKLHETASVDGEVGVLSGFLFHLTHRNLTDMLRKTIQWSTVEAKLRYEAHHPKVVWWRFPRVMLTAFWNSYITQKGFRAGTVGIIESIYQSFSMYVTYARLWEMQREKRS